MCCGEHCRLAKLSGGLSNTGRSMLDYPCEHDGCWSLVLSLWPIAQSHRWEPSDLGYLCYCVCVQKCWKLDSNCYLVNLSTPSEIMRSQFLLYNSRFSIGKKNMLIKHQYYVTLRDKWKIGPKVNINLAIINIGLTQWDLNYLGHMGLAQGFELFTLYYQSPKTSENSRHPE